MLRRRLLLGGILSLLAAMFLVPFLLLRHFGSAAPDDFRDAVKSENAATAVTR